MKTKNKRNATDSTLRNVRAANKRIKELELMDMCNQIQIAEIIGRLEKLELDVCVKKSPPIGPYPVTVRGLEKKRGKK